MKKNKVNKIVIIVFIIIAIILIRYIYIEISYPVIDINEHAVEATGFYFNDNYYRQEPFFGYYKKRFKIAEADNGAPIYAYGDKENPYFLEICGSDNSLCFIGKSVPNSGNITGILVNPSVRGINIDYITSNNDIEIFTNLSNIKGKEQTFKTYTRTKTKSYYFVYNNSHVTNEDNLGGTIIFADDKVLYVDLDNLEKYRYNENGSLNITGIVIEDNYIAEKLKQLLLK